MDVGNEEVGKPVADYFGITGDDPKVTLILNFSFSLCVPYLLGNFE